MSGRSLLDALNDTEFAGNTAAFEDLEKCLSVGDIFALVGAGASAPLYPTWSGVLRGRLESAQQRGLITDPADVQHLRKQIEVDPLEAASSFEEIFTKPIFRTEIAALFRSNIGQSTPAQEAIIRLNAKGIITTNYDDGLEEAYVGLHGKMPRAINSADQPDLIRWIQGDAFKQDGLHILHLHGTPANPENMIFTSDDYNRFYFQQGNERVVQQIWLSERLLSIGFGFTDPFFTRAAERSLRSVTCGSRHFAIVGVRSGDLLSSLLRRQFIKKYKLTPIFYRFGDSPNGSSDHSDLVVILQALNGSRSAASVAGAVPSVGTAFADAKAVAGQQAQKEFESGLFVAALSGRILYVEPRLFEPTTADDALADAAPIEIQLDSIIQGELTYLITSLPEYGLTTLGKRIYADLQKLSVNAHFANADSLPNYRKKLLDRFPGAVENGERKAVLIIDDFNLERHERLLRELSGLNYFHRFVLLTKSTGRGMTAGFAADTLPDNARVISLSHLNRSDIRSLAEKLFDTSDTNLVSTVVDKVYGDLLDLCIPLTPLNVIMYMTILQKEGDFYPLNRIQIITKYIHQLLQRPGDAYSETFSTKNRIDIISQFVYNAHANRSTYTTETEWFAFCKKYKTEALFEFDERELLRSLLNNRILVRHDGIITFKYRLFYSYFLGLFVANRHAVLASFIESDAHLSTNDLVEVISGTSADNALLVGDLVNKLRATLESFHDRYKLADSDPFAKIEWPVHDQEDEKFWKPMIQRLAQGPKLPAEVDALKTSLIAERRTQDQNVIIHKFDELELKLVAYQSALSAALRNSDNIDGELKVSAVRAILDCYYAYYQVGLIYSNVIAKHRVYFWNGILFKNEINLSGEHRYERTIIAVMFGMARAVAERAAERVGSRKLGEVFKALFKAHDLVGFHRLLNFSFLIRSKPKAWYNIAEDIIVKTDRNSFYMGSMLNASISEFENEVNTVMERESLKKLVAVIRTRREFKKNNPGSKIVTKVLNELERRKYFDK